TGRRTCPECAPECGPGRVPGLPVLGRGVGYTAPGFGGSGLAPRSSEEERNPLAQAVKHKEMTWTRAVMTGLFITGLLLIFLAWIPSHFTYFWWEKLKP